MKFIKAELGDVIEVAKLHIGIFPGFFLTTLGLSFLKQLYAGFLSHPSAIFIIAKDERGVMGFAVGTTSPDTFFPELRRKYYLSFFLKAFPSILKNPLPVCGKLLHALRYRGGASPNHPSGALLSSIGVAITCRGDRTSVGLISEFERIAKTKGANMVYLTTDAEHNDRVNAFYAKQGYVISGRFKQSSRRYMFRYEKNLLSKNSLIG